MTLTEGLSDPRVDFTRRWLMMLAALGFSVMAVAVTPLVDHDVAGGKTSQESVDFGLPVSWVYQDQTALDPPFPDRTGILSPWENPTSVSPAAFAVDVLFVFAVASGLGFALSALRRRMASRPA